MDSSFPTRIEDGGSLYQEIRTIQPVGPYFLGGASLGQNCLGDGSTTACTRRESSYAGLFDTHGPESLKPLPVHVRASRHLANLLRLELKRINLRTEGLAYRFKPQAHLKSPLLEALDQANRDYVPQVYRVGQSFSESVSGL